MRLRDPSAAAIPVGVLVLPVRAPTYCSLQLATWQPPLSMISCSCGFPKLLKRNLRLVLSRLLRSNLLVVHAPTKLVALQEYTFPEFAAISHRACAVVAGQAAALLFLIYWVRGTQDLAHRTGEPNMRKPAIFGVRQRMDIPAGVERNDG